MKERPILFNAEMVRAVLDGRKTVMRRVVKPQPPENTLRVYHEETPDFSAQTGRWYPEYLNEGRLWTDGASLRCPYGVPGDRLWVRETWRVGAWRHPDELPMDTYGDRGRASPRPGRVAIDYRASPDLGGTPWCFPEPKQFDRLIEQSLVDSSAAASENDEKCWYDGAVYGWEAGDSPCRWRPSIFLPRWASRIDLEVTAVRVERVQEITDGDALAEGVDPGCGNCGELSLPNGCGCDSPEPLAQDSFICLWNSIHAEGNYGGGPLGWTADPWVWVVEFKAVSDA